MIYKKHNELSTHTITPETPKKTDVWWHLEFQVAHFSSTAHFWIHINIGRWNAYPAWIDNMLKENKEKQPNLKNNYIWLLFCIAAGVSNLIMEVPFTQEKDTRVSKDQHYTVYRIPIPKNVPKSSNHHPGNFFFFWGGEITIRRIPNWFPIKSQFSLNSWFHQQPVSRTNQFL